MGRTKKSIPGAIDDSDNARSQNFAFELYEESCNPDWADELEKLHVPAFAIWHNKDLSAKEDGSQKKPHCHVLLMYGAVKTKAQVLNDVKILKPANNMIVRIADRRGYGRYLCHLDNAEKHQYDPSEVMCFAGANYKNFLLSESDVKDVSRSQSREITKVIETFRPATMLDLENLLYYNDELYDYATRYNSIGVGNKLKRLEKRPDSRHVGAEDKLYNYYINEAGEVYEQYTGMIIPSPFDAQGNFIKGYVFPLLDDPKKKPDVVSRAVAELQTEGGLSESEMRTIIDFWRSPMGQKYLYRYIDEESKDDEQVSSDSPSSESSGDSLDDCPFPPTEADDETEDC